MFSVCTSPFVFWFGFTFKITVPHCVVDNKVTPIYTAGTSLVASFTQEKNSVHNINRTVAYKQFFLIILSKHGSC